MKKSILQINILFIALLFFSCENNTEIGNIDKLVIQAYLFPDQTIDSFRISKVLPFEATTDTLPIAITPIIIDSNGQNYPLSPLEDPAYFATDELVISAGGTYSFEIEYNGELVSGQTFIPSPPENVQLSEQIIYRKRINDFQDIQNQDFPDPIEITWDNNNGDYFFVDVKNTDDNPQVINELFDSGAVGPGTTVTAPNTSNSYAINAFSEITHFGNYEVTVYRVNPEYVVLYESNTEGSSGLNEITTNVKNAFGIFTGINYTKITFEVKEQ